MRIVGCCVVAVLLTGLMAGSWGDASFAERFPETAFEPLLYQRPGLVVDLGVGLWASPFPVDYDGDGDMDLLVSTADKPYNGLYLFENKEGNVKFPIFEPAKWLRPGAHNTTISYIGEDWELMIQGDRLSKFREGDMDTLEAMGFKPEFHLGRAKQWKRYDYDNDGALDLILGVSDWREYGWDDAFSEKGEWIAGPLHGYVYFVKNLGSTEVPEWAAPVKLEADGKWIDVYGCPSPNFADWDGDGDDDLMCGEFVDSITYFENIGSREAPRFVAGRKLMHQGEVIRMDLEMMQVVAVDWDQDGDTDLVVGQEDGRVALMDNLGTHTGGMPDFALPRFFEQKAERVKVGALCTPKCIDWDGDGDEDLIVGDTAGYINFVENLDGGDPPQWAAPVYLKAEGETIRIQAGANGSIQGPAEAKWGYTVLDVADWDQDGLLDIMINSIWGKVEWFKNVGTAVAPALAKAQPVEVEWDGATPKPAWFWWNPEGKALVTQWRTSPQIYDINGDGLNDLVMLDQEGYLASFERAKQDGKLVVLPPKRIFLNEKGEPFRLNERDAGGSGRRKWCFADWDQDGKLDILINSKNIDFLRNIGENGVFKFKNEGLVDPHHLAGHTTCPTVVDWNRDGVPDLLIGAEDGFLYYLKNPYKQIKTTQFFIHPDAIQEATHVEVKPQMSGKSFAALPASEDYPGMWYMPTATHAMPEGRYIWYQRVDKSFPEYTAARTLCLGIWKEGKLELPSLREGDAPWGGPNNIALTRSPYRPNWGGFNVFQMAHTDAGFKLLYWDQPGEGAVAADQIGQAPGNGDAGAMLATSTDGKHWETDRSKTVFTEHNDAYTLLPVEDGYYLYQTRLEEWKDKPFVDNIPDKRRVICVRESKDLNSFTPQETILRPDGQDSPETEFYLMTVFPYQGYYVGLVMKYFADPARPKEHSGIIATEVMLSKDGKEWDRPFRDMNPGFWSYTAPFPEEGSLTFTAHFERGLWMFQYKPNRFIGVQAEETEGSFTIPMTTAMRQGITVDADTSKGWLAVEVIDSANATVAKSNRIEGIDAEQADLSWESMPEAWPDDLRLRIRMQQAKLFALSAKG